MKRNKIHARQLYKINTMHTQDNIQHDIRTIQVQIQYKIKIQYTHNTIHNINCNTRSNAIQYTQDQMQYTQYNIQEQNRVQGQNTIQCTQHEMLASWIISHAYESDP